MTVEKRPIIMSGDTSFEAVLNSACERLWSKQTQCVLRRISEMNEELSKLEKELDQFINV